MATLVRALPSVEPSVTSETGGLFYQLVAEGAVGTSSNLRPKSVSGSQYVGTREASHRCVFGYGQSRHFAE